MLPQNDINFKEKFCLVSNLNSRQIPVKTSRLVSRHANGHRHHSTRPPQTSSNSGTHVLGGRRIAVGTRELPLQAGKHDWDVDNHRMVFCGSGEYCYCTGSPPWG